MSSEKSSREGFIDILPDLLWVLLAAIALFIFYQPLSTLLTRSTKVKLGAFEVEAPEQFEKAVKRLPAVLSQGTPNAQILRLKTQWENFPERARPYRILVAHDVFIEAKPIQRAFIDLGFEADIALCPDEIERALKQHLYDAVVSDINWTECKQTPPAMQNGVTFLKYATEQGFAQPTVFFIANYDLKLGVPKDSYGISNNWYDVLEYVFTVIRFKLSSVQN